jgi:hypothetical protein
MFEPVITEPMLKVCQKIVDNSRTISTEDGEDFILAPRKVLQVMINDLKGLLDERAAATSN